MRYNGFRQLLITAAVSGGLAWFAGTAYAGQQPDNTAANKGQQTTADQAKNNMSDRDMMQKIRQNIVDDKNLSTYAHNCKVIAKNGKVTLKGPVRSEEEKQSIESKAREVAGAGNVVNELTVKPEKANRKAKSDNSSK